MQNPMHAGLAFRVWLHPRDLCFGARPVPALIYTADISRQMRRPSDSPSPFRSIFSYTSPRSSPPVGSTSWFAHRPRLVYRTSDRQHGGPSSGRILKVTTCMLRCGRLSTPSALPLLPHHCSCWHLTLTSFPPSPPFSACAPPSRAASVGTAIILCRLSRAPSHAQCSQIHRFAGRGLRTSAQPPFPYPSLLKRTLLTVADVLSFCLSESTSSCRKACRGGNSNRGIVSSRTRQTLIAPPPLSLPPSPSRFNAIATCCLITFAVPRPLPTS